MPAPFKNAFIDQPSAPSDTQLTNALGHAKPAWDGLLFHLEAQCGASTREWKSYSKKAGWSLRVLKGKRTIVWLSPYSGEFQVTVILGEKALAALRHSELSPQEQELLNQAERYPEGSSVRLAMRNLESLPTVQKFVAAKLQN